MSCHNLFFVLTAFKTCLCEIIFMFIGSFLTSIQVLYGFVFNDTLNGLGLI